MDIHFPEKMQLGDLELVPDMLHLLHTSCMIGLLGPQMFEY